MPLGLVARLRLYRRPVVMIAAGLIAVQAFLAGLANAQAALMPAPNLADFAVICHGNGGADLDNGTVPDPAPTDPAKNQHPCCAICFAGASPAMLPQQQIVLRSGRCRVFKSRFFCAASIPIAPRAVRAGPSRAPPSLG